MNHRKMQKLARFAMGFVAIVMALGMVLMALRF